MDWHSWKVDLKPEAFHHPPQPPSSACSPLGKALVPPGPSAELLVATAETVDLPLGKRRKGWGRKEKGGDGWFVLKRFGVLWCFVPVGSLDVLFDLWCKMVFFSTSRDSLIAWQGKEKRVVEICVILRFAFLVIFYFHPLFFLRDLLVVFFFFGGGGS